MHACIAGHPVQSTSIGLSGSGTIWDSVVHFWGMWDTTGRAAGAWGSGPAPTCKVKWTHVGGVDLVAWFLHEYVHCSALGVLDHDRSASVAGSDAVPRILLIPWRDNGQQVQELY